MNEETFFPVKILVCFAGHIEEGQFEELVDSEFIPEVIYDDDCIFYH